MLKHARWVGGPIGAPVSNPAPSQVVNPAQNVIPKFQIWPLPKCQIPSRWQQPQKPLQSHRPFILWHVGDTFTIQQFLKQLLLSSSISSDITLITTMSCSDAFQTAQTGLQALAHAIDRMVQGQLRAFVENNLLDLPEVVRRLLSHYGAVGGCSAGHQWKEKSHDGTNVIYSSVWEYWKGEEHYSKFWKCRSITNRNTAGKSPRTMPIDKICIQDGFSEPSQKKMFLLKWVPGMPKGRSLDHPFYPR